MRAALLELLRTWAAGPDAQEAADGLTGGLDEDVATIADVTIDDGTVTVDLVGGEQVGVLGTTTGGATFTRAVVGMVLQYEQFDAVRFTLDGSCEAFGALAESPECLTYDESLAPWAQGP